MANNSLGSFWTNTSDSFIASHPLDFSADGSLIILENQPFGSLVGKLNTNAPDTKYIVYSLVSGSGDQHNVLFSVDANGTVTSNAIFDYENNNFSFSIGGNTSHHDSNASYEKALTILWFEIKTKHQPFINLEISHLPPYPKKFLSMKTCRFLLI